MFALVGNVFLKTAPVCLSIQQQSILLEDHRRKECLLLAWGLEVPEQTDTGARPVPLHQIRRVAGPPPHLSL